jgi:hypothetical protein
MTIVEALAELRGNETNIRFVRLVAIATAFFGNPRKKGSHYIFKMPWPGDPRINLQSEKGKAKPYQIRQLISALERLKGE